MRCSLVIAWLLAGCGSSICARHSDCATDEVCTLRGECAVAPDDAGTLLTGDGGVIDVSDADVDAAPIDAATDAPGDAP
jgi:hypothetical protein